MKNVIATIFLVVSCSVLVNAQSRETLKTTTIEEFAAQEKRAASVTFTKMVRPDGRTVKYVKPVMPALLPDSKRTVTFKIPVPVSSQIEGESGVTYNKEDVKIFTETTVDLGTLNLGKLERTKPE